MPPTLPTRRHLLEPGRMTRRASPGPTVEQVELGRVHLLNSASPLLERRAVDVGEVFGGFFGRANLASVLVQIDSLNHKRGAGRGPLNRVRPARSMTSVSARCYRLPWDDGTCAPKFFARTCPNLMIKLLSHTVPRWSRRTELPKSRAAPSQRRGGESGIL